MKANFDMIATYYDTMYVDSKEYEAEAEKIHQIVKKYGKTENNTLLDIACGTGEQSLFLSKYFQVTGTDISEAMLKVARSKAPQVKFIANNMFDFTMKEKFDVIVNLYGSIGFAKEHTDLDKALLCAYNSLADGGIFILTPWSTQESFQEGVLANSGYNSGVSFCRMESVNRIDKETAQVKMYHLIGENNKIKAYHYTQNISLWREVDYLLAIEKNGFTLLERLGELDFRMGAFICRK